MRTSRLTAVTLLTAAMAMAACSATGSAGSPPASAGASAPPTQPSPSDAFSPDPSPTPAPPLTDPDGNHIATGLTVARPVSAESPLTEIFVVEADGELRQVTGLSGASTGAAGPVWSPDGEMIAFGPSVLGSESFPAVLLVNADGSEQRLLQQLDAEEFSRPSWSGDGTHLLFADATPPGDRRIWLADLASGTVTRIGTGAVPRWLPGDERIVFVHGVAGLVPGDSAALTQVVFVMDLDDLVPQDFAHAENAHWSPDGGAVLIEQDGLILLADADGSNRHELAEGASAVWSPDGNRIAYLSGHDQDGRSLVAVMDRDGTLIWSGVAGSTVAWSPDGSRLAVDVRYPERVVQVIDAATGELLWETQGTDPTWRP